MTSRTVQRKRGEAKKKSGRTAKQTERVRDSAKKIREKTRKRSKSFFNKGDELWKLCGVSVAIFTYDPARDVLSTFRSSDDPDWPPDMREIVSTFSSQVDKLTVGRVVHFPQRSIDCQTTCLFEAGVRRIM